MSDAVTIALQKEMCAQHTSARDIVVSSDVSFDQVSQGYTGINPNTGLANDFLNQYNEIIMLIECLPLDLEAIDVIQEWRPLSYVEHFKASGFADTEKVLEAYARAPAGNKQRFGTILNDLNHMLSGVLSDFVSAAKTEAGDGTSLLSCSLALATEIRAQAQALRAIISADLYSQQSDEPQKISFADVKLQHSETG